MKYFFILFFISSLNLMASDSHICTDLEHAYFQTENEIYASCKEEDKNDSSCKTYKERLDEYNAALASLIIEEGLISLSASINENKTALSHVTDKKIEEIKKTATSLKEDLKKAQLLSLVAEPGVATNSANSESSYKRPYILDDYKDGDLKTYLEDKCQNESNKKFKVCQKIKALNQDALKTLEGFTHSLSKIEEKDRTNEYKKVIDYLELNKREDSRLSYDSEKFEKIISNLENIEQTQDKKTLLGLTKTLSKIDTKFASSDLGPLFETGDPKERIAHTFETIESTYFTLLGIDKNKEKLEGISTAVKREQEKNEKTLLNKLQEQHTSCSGAQDLDSCLKELSKTNDASTGAPTSISKINDLLKTRKQSEVLARMAGCYNEKDLDLIEKCVSALKKEGNFPETNLKAANERLEKAKEDLEGYKKDSKISFLELNKAHLYHNLKKNNCIDTDESEEHNFGVSYCQGSQLDNLIISNTTLKDTEAILTNLEDLNLQEMLKAYGSDNKSNYETFIKERTQFCSEQKLDPSYCAVITFEEEEREKNQGQASAAEVTTIVTKAEQKRTKREQKILEKEKKKEKRRNDPHRGEGFNAAMEGLGMTVATNAPAIMQVNMQNRWVQEQTNMYRQSIINQQKYYDWYRSQQQYYPSYAQSSLLNFGFNAPSTLQNFGGVNQGQLFYSYNPGQFNFNSFNIQPMNSGFIQSPSSQNLPQTGGSTTNFGFGF